jgi:agmatine deiminase
MPIFTPADLAYRMPAEWAEHTRCWMIWPCREETFGTAQGLAAARRTVAAMVEAIARFEPVVLLARPADAAQARGMAGDAAQVVEEELSDSWARDVGPSFLVGPDGALGGVDWGFNAWGMTYTDFADDAALARKILDRAGGRRFAAPLILEGGSLSVDGDGTVLVTEQCLLNGNRNPHLTRQDIEQALMAYLGVEKVIWLKDGLENDETDGHVDEIACFAAPGVVLLAGCDDPADPNHGILAENRAILEAARDAQGRPLRLITLPQPMARHHGHLGRLTCSYANFYIANGGIVCPSYDDPMDAQAKAVLEQAFPGREVVMVPCLPLLEGGGNIHCITQQEPKP